MKRFVVKSNYGTGTYRAVTAEAAEKKHRDEVATDAPEIIGDLRIESISEARPRRR